MTTGFSQLGIGCLAWLLAAVPLPAHAQPASPARVVPFVVSASWVAEHLGQAPLVLLHVGERAEYDGTHIPGAQYISVGEITTERDGRMYELPPVDKLEAEFEKRGVSDSSLIVLYFGRDWVSPTTRVFLTLDYLGLGERTAILDGGLPAWRAGGHPLTATITSAAPGSLTPRARPEAVADLAFVKASLNTSSVAIIDARTPDFYSGENDGRGRIPRPGHIAGAASVPFNSVVTDDNRFKDATTLRALLLAAGADPGDRVVSYCHLGQQATVIYFVARMLGYDAKLYDGSFNEWTQHPTLPVEKSQK